MTRDEWLLTFPKNLIWAELGVFLGDFSKLIYRSCNPSHLHLVDTFPSEMWSGDKDGNNIQKRNLSDVPSQLESHFSGNQVTVHKISTVNFLRSSSDRNLDVVYIDADHSYEAVRLDLEESLKRVKIGGIISGHDYSSTQFPGVFRAVNEFCKENNLVIRLLTSDNLPTYMIEIKE